MLRVSSKRLALARRALRSKSSVSPQRADSGQTDDASALAKGLLDVTLVPETTVQSIPDVTSSPPVDQEVPTDSHPTSFGFKRSRVVEESSYGNKYANAGVIQLVRKSGELLEEEYREDGIYIRAYVPMEIYAKL